MSLTRKMLKAMGIDEEKIDQIIEAHTETVDAIKKERDTFEGKASKLDGVQKELDDLKAKGDDGYKQKYEEEHSAFENYKAEQAAKETKQSKEHAFRELLKDAGVSEKRIDAIVRISDIDAIELNDEGKIKDADERTEKIKTEWADFIPTTEVKGAKTANPPSQSSGNTMTRESIMAIKDRTERRNAIAQNIELFE